MVKHDWGETVGGWPTWSQRCEGRKRQPASQPCGPPRPQVIQEQLCSWTSTRQVVEKSPRGSMVVFSSDVTRNIPLLARYLPAPGIQTHIHDSL
jgi:hypothetical protein